MSDREFARVVYDMGMFRVMLAEDIGLNSYFIQQDAQDDVDQINKAHSAALASAAAQEREQSAGLLDLSGDAIRLMAGEMSAETMRCVKAILKNRAAAIRSRK